MNQEQEQELDAGAEEFARRARELLESSAAQLPGHIRSRLTRARYAALEQRGASRGYRPARWQRWLPAGAAAAAVLAVLMMQGPRPTAELPQATTGGEDFEILADSGAYALVQDQLSPGGDVDYEFYDWAVHAAQDERGAEAGS
jgi:uncharacterized protein DUF3619